MFGYTSKKKIPATEKQIRCIEIMNDIISKDLDFTEEELEKRNKFLEDYKEVQRAIKQNIFTIGTASYIIKKWMSFSYDIRNNYLWKDYGGYNGFDDRDEWEFTAHLERF